MKDSSAKQGDLFYELEWRNVFEMLSILRECTYTKKEHIRKRYIERARHFDTTIAFMRCIHALRAVDEHVELSNVLRLMDEPTALNCLFQQLFNCRNRYRTQIFNYLRRFRISDGTPQYRPQNFARSNENHVRNFLIQMGVIRHNSLLDTYEVLPKHLDLYVLAQEAAAKRTPTALESRQASREALGTAAEEVIVCYEQQRLGRFADHVEHVALVNASAGYDVRSVTVNQESIAPRYIEVKAVSGSCLRFHWTHNETLTAKLFGVWYYLYLLPVGDDGCFAINDLRIIENPYDRIFGASNQEWVVETDVVRCHLRNEDGRARSSNR